MKKMFVFTFIFVLAFVNSALAHTGLETSSPQNGEVIKEELREISLTFETKIEQGSTFELKNSNGNSIVVDEIVLNENKMVGNLPNPLENGEYQVNWNIIGADGHPIEGEFSFSVEVPATETPAEEQVETQEETQPQSKGEESQVDTVNKEKDEEIQQNKMPSYVMPTIIGALIIIVVGSLFFILKRKK